MFAGYTIVRLLGSGGMGEVYLAQHPRLPRRDALKVLPASVSADSEYRERFNREADIAATLWHPHIVGVHDRGEFDGQIWISMDYVEGTDAARLLRERYPDGMPKSEVAAIVAAVADALDYAHQRNLLHRDVKPANILLAQPDSGDQRILLADFGIARWANEISGLTATNMTVGTVSYAAPEQLMGRATGRPRGSIRVGGHRISSADGLAPVRTLEPRRRDQPAPLRSSPCHRRAPPGSFRARPGAGQGAGEGSEGPVRALRGFRPRAGASAGATSNDGTGVAPVVTTARESQRRSLLRASVLVPAILAVLLVAAIAVAVIEFRRADRPEATPAAKSPAITAPTTTSAPAATATSVTADDHRDVGASGRSVRGGDRRQLLARRQHRNDGGRVDRVLLDAADDRRLDLVAQPGRRPEPHRHHRADRRTAALPGGVPGAGMHAADRPDPA